MRGSKSKEQGVIGLCKRTKKGVRIYVYITGKAAVS